MSLRMLARALLWAAVAPSLLAAPAATTTQRTPPAAQVYKRTEDRGLQIAFTLPDDWQPGDRRAALVYFYNGGWGGGANQFGDQAAYLARRGVVVAQADYREKDRSGVTSRKCMADVCSGMRWLRAHGGELGIDPARIAAAGGSGSAHLVASLFYADEVREPGDDAALSPTPGALLLYNPDLDVIEREAMARVLGGGKYRAIAAAAPPILVFVGTEDPLYPFAMDFVARGKSAGMPIEACVGEGGPHGFFKFSPWLETTTLRADTLLRSIGYLGEEPRAAPPSKTAPASYGQANASNQARWLERHNALLAEGKGYELAAPRAADSAAVTAAARKRATATVKDSGAFTTTVAVSVDSAVYKTVDGHGLKIEVNKPPDWNPSDRRAAIVFFAGGGMSPGKGEAMGPSAGPGEGFLEQAQYFAARGMVALRVEYRKRKREDVMPYESITDAVAAMRWVRASAAKLGVDPNRIASAGGSSGGNLAAAVYALEEFHHAEGAGDPSVSCRPNAMLLFFPLLDWLAESSMSGQFLAALDGDRKLAERLSPARHWRADAPPTLILIGTRDPMYESLKAFTAEWKGRGAALESFVVEGAPHGFSNQSPWMEQSTQRADEFLQSLGYLSQTPRVPLPSKEKKKKDSKGQADRKETRDAAAGERPASPAAPIPAAAGSVAALVAQLLGGDPNARVKAALALLELGPAAREAYPALVDALTSDDEVDYRVAAHALYAGARTADDIPALIAALTSDTRARAAAAYELSRIGPAAKDAVPALIAALSSEDKHARNFAAVALGMVGPQARAAIPALIETLRDSGSPDSPQTNYKYARAAAAFALGAIGPDAKAAGPALIDLLSSDAKHGAEADWEFQRAAACFALGRIAPDSQAAAAALAQAKSDASEIVRAHAARALQLMADAPRQQPSTPFAELNVARGKTGAFALPALRAITESGAADGGVARGGKRKAPAIHESASLALGYLASLPASPSLAELAAPRGQYDERIVRYVMALGAINQSIVPVLLETLAPRMDSATPGSGVTK